MQTYNYRKGLPAMAVCYLFWGLQPLYYALDPTIDTYFLLASRIFWAAISCLVIVALQGKLGQLKEVFTTKKIISRELPASFLLLADWTIYLIGVKTNRIMECSMGYFIMPIVIFTFGAIFFKEKITWKHIGIIAIIVVGIVLSAKGFGGFPLITLALAFLFAIYAAIKKSLEVDSIVSTTSEIIIMSFFAIIYLIIFCRGESGFASLTVPRVLYLIGSGVVSGLPLVFYSIGVRYLPMTLTGILQYTSPTLDLVCGVILGEVFNVDKVISFSFIILGVILYSIMTYLDIRKAKKETTQNEVVE